METKNNTWKVIAFIIAVIIVFRTCTSSDDKSAPVQKTPIETAKIYGQMIIKNKLSAPETAEFPYDDQEISETKQNVFIYKGIVKHTNAYNVPFKSPFLIELKYNGGPITADDSWTNTLIGLSNK